MLPSLFGQDSSTWPRSFSLFVDLDFVSVYKIACLISFSWNVGRMIRAQSRRWPGSPGGGGHLGILWVGMCRPGLQIGTPF